MTTTDRRAAALLLHHMRADVEGQRAVLAELRTRRDAEDLIDRLVSVALAYLRVLSDDGAIERCLLDVAARSAAAEATLS